MESVSACSWLRVGREMPHVEFFHVPVDDLYERLKERRGKERRGRRRASDSGVLIIQFEE